VLLFSLSGVHAQSVNRLLRFDCVLLFSLSGVRAQSVKRLLRYMRGFHLFLVSDVFNSAGETGPFKPAEEEA
jgi:hypothetical protein